MSAADFLVAIVAINLTIAIAIAFVLALRGPIRRLFGAVVGYRLWFVVLLAPVALLLPARTVLVESSQDNVAMELAILPPAPILPWFELALLVWASGAAIALIALALSQRAAVSQFGEVKAEGDIWRAGADEVGPALIGLLRPRIIVPTDFEARFTPEERSLVIAHERAHLAAGDLWVNAIAALVQALCWFNPLVHMAARRLRVDQELACDSAVLARLPAQRSAYASALLKTQVVDSSPALACAWPPGSTSLLKERIAMLKSDMPGAPRRIAGFAAVMMVGVAVATTAWAARPAEEVAAAPMVLAQAEAPNAPAKPEPVEKEVFIIQRGVTTPIDKDALAGIEKGEVKRVEIIRRRLDADGKVITEDKRTQDVRVGAAKDGVVIRRELDKNDQIVTENIMRIERAPGDSTRFWIGEAGAKGAKTEEIKRFELSQLSAEQREKMKTIRLNADAAALKALEAQRDRIDKRIAEIKERQAKGGEPVPPMPAPAAPPTVP